MQRKPFLQRLKHPSKMVAGVIVRLYRLFPNDKIYLKLIYRLYMGRKLDLKNPKTFSEKIQWLKLYDRRPEYTIMVDKYTVKQYVAERIGEEYIIPTIGVWESPEKIDWDSLPQKFVLKTTHGGGGGGVIVCKNKSSINREKVVRRLKKQMRTNIYGTLREWPYRNVKPRIIAEELIESRQTPKDLPDYKFFCFNGKAKYCQVISNRSGVMSIDFFDMEWNHQPFHEPKIYPFAADLPTKPQNFEKMESAANMLAKGKDFVRVDFYDIGEFFYFGEITFYPSTGMGGFDPDDYDLILGKMIELPGEKRGGGIINLLWGDCSVQNANGSFDHGLMDYKIFCFHGIPKIIKVNYDTKTDYHSNWYDLDWKYLGSTTENDPTDADVQIPCPIGYDKMILLAEKLSNGMPFVRVDFYNVWGMIKFGEMTFFPGSGFEKFVPESFDYDLGKMIKL